MSSNHGDDDGAPTGPRVTFDDRRSTVEEVERNFPPPGTSESGGGPPRRRRSGFNVSAWTTNIFSGGGGGGSGGGGSSSGDAGAAGRPPPATRQSSGAMVLRVGSGIAQDHGPGGIGAGDGASFPTPRAGRFVPPPVGSGASGDRYYDHHHDYYHPRPAAAGGPMPYPSYGDPYGHEYGYGYGYETPYVGGVAYTPGINDGPFHNPFSPRTQPPPPPPRARARRRDYGATVHQDRDGLNLFVAPWYDDDLAYASMTAERDFDNYIDPLPPRPTARPRYIPTGRPVGLERDFGNYIDPLPPRPTSRPRYRATRRPVELERDGERVWRTAYREDADDEFLREREDTAGESKETMERNLRERLQRLREEDTMPGKQKEKDEEGEGAGDSDKSLEDIAIRVRAPRRATVERRTRFAEVERSRSRERSRRRSTSPFPAGRHRERQRKGKSLAQPETEMIDFLKGDDDDRTRDRYGSRYGSRLGSRIGSRYGSYYGVYSDDESVEVEWTRRKESRGASPPLDEKPYRGGPSSKARDYVLGTGGSADSGGSSTSSDESSSDSSSSSWKVDVRISRRPPGSPRGSRRGSIGGDDLDDADYYSSSEDDATFTADVAYSFYPSRLSRTDSAATTGMSSAASNSGNDSALGIQTNGSSDADGLLNGGAGSASGKKGPPGRPQKSGPSFDGRYINVLNVFESRYTGDAKFEGTHAVTLTVIHDAKKQRQPLFRWM